MFDNDIRVILLNENYRFKTSSDSFHGFFCICLQFSPQGCAECLSVPLTPPDHSDQSRLSSGGRAISKLALFPCPATSPPSPCQPPSPEEAPNRQLATNFKVSHRSSSVPSVLPVMQHIGTQAYVFPETLSRQSPSYLFSICSSISSQVLLLIHPTFPQVFAEGCYSIRLCPF